MRLGYRVAVAVQVAAALSACSGNTGVLPGNHATVVQSQGGAPVGRLAPQLTTDLGLSANSSIVCNRYREKIKNIGKGVPNCQVSGRPRDVLYFPAPFSGGGGCSIEQTRPADYDVWTDTPGTCTPTVYDRTTGKTVRGRKIRFIRNSVGLLGMDDFSARSFENICSPAIGLWSRRGPRMA